MTDITDAERRAIESYMANNEVTVCPAGARTEFDTELGQVVTVLPYWNPEGKDKALFDRDLASQPGYVPMVFENDRDLRVARLASEGMTVKQIAADIGASTASVVRTMRRCGVSIVVRGK